MFSDLTGTTLEYRKTSHSLALTEWLLKNDLKSLEELLDYVETLVPLRD
jgi:hypothetical protein